jgi:hypothetical protein
VKPVPYSASSQFIITLSFRRLLAEAIDRRLSLSKSYRLAHAAQIPSWELIQWAKYRWSYVPEMRADEVLLLKCFAHGLR